MGIKKNVWAWIASLYFIEGFPNAVVASLSLAYYKSMGLSNGAVAALTSLLYLPWMLKGFWGALVDSVSTKQKWVFRTLCLFIVCFLSLAVSQFSSHWVLLTATCFWILGFASATFDIAADGFYLIALDKQEQSFFAGIRSAFYRLSTIFVQGALFYLAGWGHTFFNSKELAWSFTFVVCMGIVALSFFILKISLGTYKEDEAKQSDFKSVRKNIKESFVAFFSDKNIISIVLFLMFYRFAEAQLVKMTMPFFLDPYSSGGLALDLKQIGLYYGTFGSVALLLGAILGGILISKFGLTKLIYILALAINIPNLIYVFLAYVQPSQPIIITGLISVEQFGYGLGFSGYMVFMMYVANNYKNKTAVYAICTSIMALSLILPGAISGFIQESLNSYVNFFYWIMVSTLVSLGVSVLAKRVLKSYAQK